MTIALARVLVVLFVPARCVVADFLVAVEDVLIELWTGPGA